MWRPWRFEAVGGGKKGRQEMKNVRLRAAQKRLQTEKECKDMKKYRQLGMVKRGYPDRSVDGQDG